MRHGSQIEFFRRTILHVTVRFGSSRFSAVANDQPKRIGRLTVSNQDDLWLPLSKPDWRNEKAHHESKQRQEIPVGHVLMSYPRNDTYFVGINRLRIETRAKRPAPSSEVPLDFSIPVWYHNFFPDVPTGLLKGAMENLGESKPPPFRLNLFRQLLKFKLWLVEHFPVGE